MPEKNMLDEESQTIKILSTALCEQSGQDYYNVLGQIVQKGAKLIGANVGTLGLVDEKERQLWVKVLFGLTQDMLYSHSIDEGITGWVARKGRSKKVDDVNKCEIYKEYWHDTKSELAVPIKCQGKVIGVLNFESDRHAFNDEDCKAIEKLADYTSVAIETVRLKKLHDLLKSTKDLTQELDYELSLEKIVKRGMELTGADSLGSICLLERDQGSIDQRFLARIYIGNQLKTEEYPISEGITGLAAEIRRSCIIPDVNSHSRYKKFSDITKSELAVPIFYGNDLIGVLNVESKKINAFTLIDREILEALAEFAAIAIQHARLYQETIKKANFLEGFYKIGTQITPNLNINHILREITRSITNIIEEVDIPLIYLYNFDCMYDEDSRYQQELGEILSPAKKWFGI